MKPAKYLLISILLYSGFSAYAGHLKGGLILSYESVGHVTGNPLDYVLSGYKIEEYGGVPPTNNKSIKISSSCFSTITFNLPLISSNLVGPQSDNCTPGLSLSSTSMLAVYQDTITLPGVCWDYLFSHTGLLWSYLGSTNIGGFHGNHAYYYTKLNNTQGPNSSPKANTADIIQGACVNNPLRLYGFTEYDGDSVFYSPSAPDAANGIGTVFNFGFAPGYSKNNPVGSSQGYVMDPTNGTVQTMLDAVGNYSIAIMYEEYRFVNVTSSWQKISEGKFIMFLIGSATCTTTPFVLQYPSGSMPDTVQCGENRIRIATSERMVQGSITLSGSEFSVTSPLGNHQVTAAQPLNDSVIELQLAQPIPANTSLSVTVQSGNDGNVFFSYCGMEMGALADTLRFYTTQASAATAAFSHSANYLSVNFTSNASGDSLSWDFGDGSIPVTATNPNHVYSTPGQYQVSQIAFNICNASDTLSQMITVCDTLRASFEFSQSGDTLEVDAGASLGADSYYWDFGDGNTGNGSNPVHYYSYAGSFVVVLTVTNACGDSATFTDTVHACSPPVAYWSYTIVSSGAGGIAVDFDATASRHLDSYYWDFGDGNSGTGQIVSHSYSGRGIFVVRMIGVNACGDSAIFGDSLETCADPIPDWTYSVLNTGGTGMVVDFDGTASQNIDSFLWDFDDGNTNNTSLTPQHTYTTPSLAYRVTLSITNECGQTDSYAYRLDQIGLDEWTAGPILKMYPNPATDHLNLETTEAMALISVLALDGKLLYQNQMEDSPKEQSISTEGFPPGLYFVHVKFADGNVALEKVAVR